MQLSIIDPSIDTVMTQAMHDDAGLRQAIELVRFTARTGSSRWPHVEHVGTISGRPAWAVDDLGMRFVVVGGTIFAVEELGLVARRVREAATDFFEGLDLGRAAAC